MRRDVRRAPEPGGVRAAYARAMRERWEHRERPWQYYRHRVERLEANDEPVVVHWWEVLRFVPHLRNPNDGGTEFVRLEVDGSVTLVEPVRDGLEIEEWRPVA